MGNVIDPVCVLSQHLQEHGKSIRPEQEEMIRPMFESLQKKGIVFVGQGPTGMGKTYVIVAVTKCLVEKGKRVCIAVPSYTHLKEVMAKHLDYLEVPYAILRGISALEENEGCPLKNGKRPSSIFCSEQENAITGPYSEKCKDVKCVVKAEKEKVASSSVVITVFHKLLSNPSYMNKFDVVIFDESHGLEPVVRNIRVAKVHSKILSTLSEFIPEYEDVFNRVMKSIDRLKSLGMKERIPLRFVEREIADPLAVVVPEIEKKIYEEEKAGQLNEEVVNAFFGLQNAMQAFQNPSKFRFVHHKGMILGIPNEITFVPHYLKKIVQDTSIALISATIENPKFHAKDSGFPDHSLAPPVQIRKCSFMERLKRRPIFGLVDGPILRKDPYRLEEYELGRREANQIIGSILPTFNYPVLILCRSHTDADSIRKYLINLHEIRHRLFVFEDSNSFEDIDRLETKVNKIISSGRNIILTSASSRLWEGVNLRGLRMLIVDALPYASPQPYEQIEREAWGSWRTSRTFRFMIRRIQQGIGRLIRTKEDPWGIVVVIDGRFNAQWRTIRSALPDYMTNPSITKFVTRKNIRSVIERTVERLEKGRLPNEKQ